MDKPLINKQVRVGGSSNKTSHKIDKRPPKYSQADKNYKLFAKHLIKEKGNVVQAYQNTYPSANAETARKRGNQLIKSNPRAYNAIVTELEAKGMDSRWYAKELKLLAKAKKVNEYDDNGRLIKTTDNAIRLAAIKTALQLCGHLQPGVQITTDNRQVTIGVDTLDHRQLKALTLKIAELNRALNFDEEDSQSGEIYDADFSIGDASVGMTDEDVAGIVEGE